MQRNQLEQLRRGRCRHFLAGLSLVLAMSAACHAAPGVDDTDATRQYVSDASQLRLFGVKLEDAIFPGFKRESRPGSRASAQRRFQSVARKYPISGAGAQPSYRAEPVDHRDNVLRLRF